MAMSADDLVQRGHNFAVVDEVDSILIDEARTPLIISGPAEQSAKWYQDFAKIVTQLERGVEGDESTEADYVVDESKRTVAISERGVGKVEARLGVDNLYESANTPLVGYLNNALKAKELYKIDKDYIVSDDKEVLIVDEFTGRILHGRRYNEGMHQAIEAKERRRDQAGEPDSCHDHAAELLPALRHAVRHDRHGADRGGRVQQGLQRRRDLDSDTPPDVRDDRTDVIYKTERSKFNAVVEDIAERHETGQPVLVGTVSVENSEELSKLLRRRGIAHSVLNAKYHAREAEIVAQAGRKGGSPSRRTWPAAVRTSCSAATRSSWPRPNSASRGIDPTEQPEEYAAAWEDALPRWKKHCHDEGEEVVAAGGLYVLGTERHESRRIDNQLRGRSGRQGDPGESRFYLSCRTS